ncbi:MAG TPA: DUF4390 domain-containing protein [Burkholderiales bacterium]|nr:DUF4390 domain-containing protein [Burkholderiales bacterium]
MIGTTVSISRCYKKNPKFALPRIRLFSSLLLSLITPHAQAIEITFAELKATEESYVVNTNIDMQLSPMLEDALNKGVALYFRMEFELMQPRWYWFDKVIARESQEFKLSYNALTRQYRLNIGSLYQNFATLHEALAVMSRLRNWAVADRKALHKDTAYAANLRMRLDVSQLPKPFQVDALASREWNVSSDWYRFKVLL